jgi:predicted PurR-regulated permease PerM
MKKTKPNTLSKVMIAGMLMAVGVVTVGLLGVGLIQQTSETPVQTTAIAKQNIERLNQIQPAAGHVELHENAEFTLGHMPPQPEPVK